MSDGGQKPSNLDLYLDGLLAGEELRAFEEQMVRDPQLRAMDTIYHVEKSRGFVPMWVCRNDKEFATTFWKNLGSALTFRNAPANVASLGLSYGNVIDLSPQCVYMLFKIDGREVIVFIDK